MKRSKLFASLLAVVFILVFYGVAFSGGGAEPCPGCCPTTLPAATSGPFLYGTFTVAQDKITSGWGVGYDHYNVHIVLHHGLDQHLFSFPVPLGAEGLCAYEASDIKAEFARIPCSWKFGEPFGFDPAKYVPVISALYIAKKDFCDTPPDEMILGFVTIRLVPLVPPKPPKPPWH